MSGANYTNCNPLLETRWQMGKNPPKLKASSIIWMNCRLISEKQSWAHRSLKSLFALERTFILRAMALLEAKSEALLAN